MKKLLLCVLALGCAAVLMACEWSAVPLPLEGDEPQVISPAPDPSEITGQLAEYTSGHVDMALTIPDGWPLRRWRRMGRRGCGSGRRTMTPWTSGSPAGWTATASAAPA